MMSFCTTEPHHPSDMIEHPLATYSAMCPTNLFSVSFTYFFIMRGTHSSYILGGLQR